MKTKKAKKKFLKIPARKLLKIACFGAPNSAINWAAPLQAHIVDWSLIAHRGRYISAAAP